MTTKEKIKHKILAKYQVDVSENLICKLLDDGWSDKYGHRDIYGVRAKKDTILVYVYDTGEIILFRIS